MVYFEITVRKDAVFREEYTRWKEYFFERSMTNPMAAVETKKKMLGEMLVAGGLIKEDHLKKALDEQKRRGGRVGEILIDLGFVNEHNLAAFLGRQLHIPYVEIEKQLVDVDTVRLIPAATARRLMAIPLYKDGGTVVVATADPLNIFCIDDITKITCKLVARSWLHGAIS